MMGEGARARGEVAVGAQFVPPEEGAPQTIKGVPVIDERNGLLELVARGGVSEVVLATGNGLSRELCRAVMAAYQMGVAVTPMPVFYERLTGRVAVEHAGDYWYIALPRNEPDWVFLLLKRSVDLAAGGVGLLVTALVWLPIALAIRLEGRGPVLYRQVRRGQFGRPFTIVKFRTMRVDAEADGLARSPGAGRARAIRG